MRQQHQHDEKKHDGNAHAESAQPSPLLPGVGNPVPVAHGYAYHYRPQEGEGEAAKSAQNSSGIGIDHDERETEIVYGGVLKRCDENSGYSRQRRPESPAHRRCPVRTGAVQLSEFRIVHHGAHGHSQPCGVENHEQQPCQHQSHDHHDDVMPADRRVSDGDFGIPPEAAHGLGVVVSPDPSGCARQQQQQCYGDYHLGDLHGVAKAADHYPLQ